MLKRWFLWLLLCNHFSLSCLTLNIYFPLFLSLSSSIMSPPSSFFLLCSFISCQTLSRPRSDGSAWGFYSPSSRVRFADDWEPQCDSEQVIRLSAPLFGLAWTAKAHTDKRTLPFVILIYGFDTLKLDCTCKGRAGWWKVPFSQTRLRTKLCCRHLLNKQ